MTSEARPAASWSDYLALARPDHWVKHVFILPGIALAWVLHGQLPADLAFRLIAGFAGAALIASANYVINEWLDRETDRHHPIKAARPAVAKRLSPLAVTLEYLGLAVAGLALARLVSPLLAVTAAIFLASGLVYNVRPVRSKEVAYLDVLTEALNNPIRLVLGWAMVDSSTLPPSSLLLAYWMGGAFLMAVKRLAEYRSVEARAGAAALARYRASFARYTESSLLVSGLIYALMAAFFLAVFLIKYRIEYLLALPFVALLFGTYLGIGLRAESTAQAPERLFRERRLLLVVALVVAAFAVLTWLDLPGLDRLTDPHYIHLP